jgi:hypothetical protein
LIFFENVPPDRGGKDLETREDLSLLRNQVRTFISNLRSQGSYLSAENNTSFALAIVKKAERIFGKQEIKENISDFYTDDLHSPASVIGRTECLSRTVQLLNSMTTLLSYLDYHLGDPVAMELLSDTLSQARLVLKQDMVICSVLLCRVTLEQSLRRLCERNNIEFEPNEKASSLKDKLRKPAGVLEAYEAKEVEAKLMFENKVIHKEIEAQKEDAAALIEWTDKFIAHSLEGSNL